MEVGILILVPLAMFLIYDAYENQKKLSELKRKVDESIEFKEKEMEKINIILKELNTKFII